MERGRRIEGDGKREKDRRSRTEEMDRVRRTEGD